MRQIYKDIIIGFILASFTFSPAAFAKPQSRKVRSVSKAPLYANMVKIIKSNRKGLKVSKLVESAEPMVKKREFRDIKKMTLPYWDKKFDQVAVGKDYFKIKFKGKSLFARYVDSGPVAFMVNNQPFLWKDFLIYTRAKARLTEILTGEKRSVKKAKKVSLINSILTDIFPKAHAKEKAEQCVEVGGTPKIGKKDVYEGCQCPPLYDDDTQKGPFTVPNNSAACPTPTDKEKIKLCKNKGGSPKEDNNKNYSGCECSDDKLIKDGDRPDCSVKKTTPPPSTDEPSKKAELCKGKGGTPRSGRDGNYSGCKCPGFFNRVVIDSDVEDPVSSCPEKKKKKWLTPVLIGGGLLLLILLLKKKNKKAATLVAGAPTPSPVWTPNLEGQCPTSGARGLTQADLPPNCRTSCSATGTCTSGGHVIY